MDLELKPGVVAFVNGAAVMLTPEGQLKVSAGAQVLTSGDLLHSAADANTPTKKIYFVLQSMLLDPEHDAVYRQELADLLCDRSEASEMTAVQRSLAVMQNLVEQGQIQSAMEVCRRLSDLDVAIVETFPATQA
ncbi:flagellar biosynthesis repressor FlbT [Azospirillum sp. sgz301742]